jgi:hypothetical protein
MPNDRGNPHTTLRASLPMLLVSIFALRIVIDSQIPMLHQSLTSHSILPCCPPFQTLYQLPYNIGDWFSWVTTWTPKLKGNMKLLRQVKGYKKILPSFYLSNKMTIWLQCQVTAVIVGL